MGLIEQCPSEYGTGVAARGRGLNREGGVPLPMRRVTCDFSSFATPSQPLAPSPRAYFWDCAAPTAGAGLVRRGLPNALVRVELSVKDILLARLYETVTQPRANCSQSPYNSRIVRRRPSRSRRGVSVGAPRFVGVERGIEVAGRTVAGLARGLVRIFRAPDDLDTSPLPFPAFPEDGELPPLPGRVENALPTRLSVLLPALNEERGIRRVLGQMPQGELRQLGFDLIIQILDGGSVDRTRQYARERGAKVYVQKGWGKGSALREFLPTLQSEFCVILDSDATYSPRWIPAFASALRHGAPVLLGSRFKGKIHDGAMTPANQIGNRFLSRFASILYGQRVSDVCSGMWGFRTDVLKSFALTADGFDLEANLFAQCVRRGIPILEIPIPYYRRIGSAKLRVRTGFRIAWFLLLNRIRDTG